MIAKISLKFGCQTTDITQLKFAGTDVTVEDDGGKGDFKEISHSCVLDVLQIQEGETIEVDIKNYIKKEPIEVSDKASTTKTATQEQEKDTTQEKDTPKEKDTTTETDTQEPSMPELEG